MNATRRMFFISVIAVATPLTSADDAGVGRDNDIPNGEPPAETTPSSLENLLREISEWFSLNDE